MPVSRPRFSWIRAEHYDRTASFPADSIAAIHDAGLLTATVRERYGGQGAGLVEEFARTRPGLGRSAGWWAR